MKINELPADLAHQIARHLPPGDVLRLGATSRDCRTQSTDPRLWQAFVGQHAQPGSPKPETGDLADPRAATTGMIGQQVSVYARTQQRLLTAREHYARAVAQSRAFSNNYNSLATYKLTEHLNKTTDRVTHLENLAARERSQLLTAGVSLRSVALMEQAPRKPPST